MKKIHDLQRVIINHKEITYFFTREKNDINGNPRFRVYIIDPDAPAVYERIFKSYSLHDDVKNYIENMEA